MPDLYEYLSELVLGPDVHVLAASISKGGGRSLVKVVVDTSTGITIDEIAGISRLLRKDAGVARQVGTTDFRLEVTSPGVNASLREPWQFPRHVGRLLTVRLHTPQETGKDEARIEGQLLRAGAEGITMRLAESQREIAWERIQLAEVQLEW